jgi:hypothetical protein
MMNGAKTMQVGRKLMLRTKVHVHHAMHHAPKRRCHVPMRMLSHSWLHIMGMHVHGALLTIERERERVRAVSGPDAMLHLHVLHLHRHHGLIRHHLEVAVAFSVHIVDCKAAIEERTPNVRWLSVARLDISVRFAAAHTTVHKKVNITTGSGTNFHALGLACWGTCKWQLA